MSRALRILWRLLFFRPLVPILLMAVIYLLAALLLVAVKSNRGLVVASTSAIVAAGLTALLSERIGRYSRAAGSLGLPGHARLMRLAQGWFLAVFVLGPVVLASALGMAPVAATALLCAAAATVIAVNTFGPWPLILVPFIGRWEALGSWLALPAVQAVGTAASVWMFRRWLQLPEREERVGGFVPALFADARHEKVNRLEDPAAPSTSNEQPAQPSSGSDRMACAAKYLASGRNLPSVLALGLGYSVATTWRVVWYGSGTAILALATWYVLRGNHFESLGYVVVTGGCCATIVGRLQNILQRWVRTSTEQSLLRLAPQWPDGRLIKRAMVQSILWVQRGSIVVWAVSAIFATSVGWISKPALLAGGVAVLGTSSGFSGIVWATLAHRRVRDWHLSTVGILFLVAAGGLMIVFGGPSSSLAMVCGAALMLVPPAAGLLWYILAPLRLPIDVDPRATGMHL